MRGCNALQLDLAVSQLHVGSSMPGLLVRFPRTLRGSDARMLGIFVERDVWSYVARFAAQTIHKVGACICSSGNGGRLLRVVPNTSFGSCLAET